MIEAERTAVPSQLFEESVEAVDRLNDFYVFGGFCNRGWQPPGAVIVSEAPYRCDRRKLSGAKVRPGEAEATHRPLQS